MIAGALAPTLDDEISLIDTANLEGRSPPDTTVLRADGALVLRGVEVTPEQAVSASQDGLNGLDVRLVVDRAAPANTLMEQVSKLREAGAESVWLVTERGVDQ